MSTLKDAKIGQTVKVLKLGGDGALRQHFLDMGIIPETEITLVKYAPMGDPIELRLHGYELTLRLADAEQIEVAPRKTSPQRKTRKRRSLTQVSVRAENSTPRATVIPFPRVLS